MMDNSKQQNQSRFLIAAVLSMAVLFGWQFFFAPKPPPTDNSNTAQVANTATNTAPTPQVQATPQLETATVTPDDTPNRQITVSSPLYKVKLDSKGALATSWILVKNASSGRRDVALWADGSTDQNKIPLEVILQDNPNREYPFRLVTGDPNLDALLNNRNYQVSAESDVNIEGNATKQIDFTLKSGDVEVTKTFVFHADSYLTDLQIKATRAGQPIANAKLLIGTAIGDQNIKHHNYYLVEPEGVGYVNGTTDRHVASSVFKETKDTEGTLSVPGELDWAGVGDTYFAMAAIPAQKTSGLEYRGTKLEKEVEPFYDGIISWVTRSQKTKITQHRLTAYVPINLDGSTTQIYTGTKDYFTLSNYEEKLPGKNIGELINYSWYSWLRWIQKPVAIFLLRCLDVIYGVVGNFGLAIITFTLIFYSFFFPIRWWQSKQFKKAQANAPKMQEIQAKIKDLQKKGVPMDDPRMRQLQMEQLKLTKDALPIAGCLPMLFQIPLFVAFYTAITIGMDFRQTSFLWLPDLSLADPFHILEFLFAGSMAVSMVLTPTTPAITDEQKAQQKMMMYFMPVMMLWVMWGYPAGLLLYWFFGNIVSFAQQTVINRMNKTNPPPKEEIVDTVPKNAKKVKPKLSTS